MSFLVYDIIFLIIFLVAFSVFLYTRKHNLKKEGLFFLYRTQWGVKVIESIGKKYKKTLNFLSYVSIACGYILMAGVIYLIYTVLKVYLFSPEIVRAIKVPPIIPLVPYLPQVLKWQFIPPFYFTYWIVIIAVIAITHEMAHGIFMKRYGVKIKSTGFAFFPYFLPIFPAAFVEQDEKSMTKAKKFPQLAILSAGTFANVITSVFFLVILFVFFVLAFAPSGVIFDSYATSSIAISGISAINGIPVSNVSYSSLLDSISEEGFTSLKSGDNEYLISKQILTTQEENEGNIVVYDNAPAIKENLSSIITKINGVTITSISDVQKELSKYPPGENITITSLTDDGISEVELTLGEHPSRPGTSWLGIGFFSNERSGVLGKVIDKLAFKDPNTYYEPKFDGISVFIYNLLWWIVIIGFSVALINMLPFGIFDGGRFFYLTVLGITGSEKFAKRAFSFATSLFLFILLVLMVSWVFRFF